MDTPTRPRSSSSSSSPKSLRERGLAMMLPSFPRLRNRLWTEETLPVRNNRQLPQSLSPVPVVTDHEHRRRRRTPSPLVDEQAPETNVPTTPPPPRLLGDKSDNDHDGDAESTSDVSTLSNVSGHMAKMAGNDQGPLDAMETPNLPPVPREIEFHANQEGDEIPEWLLMPSRSDRSAEDGEGQCLKIPCPEPPRLQESSLPRLFLPQLNTAQPSPDIPRPTLGIHCKSAPVVATPFPSHGVARPHSLTTHHRTRTTWSQSGALSSFAGLSSPSLLSQEETPTYQVLGNRERYRGYGSSRSVATLSVGSLVGQSSWVTAPALTTATSSSHNNHTATTSTSNSSLASDVELSTIPERESSQRRLRRRRRVRADDIKRMLLRGRIPLPLSPFSRSPKEEVTLQRSSGCLT